MNKYLNNIKSSKINYLANFRCLIKAKNHILISLLIVILTVIHTLELKSAIPHIVSTISLRIIILLFFIIYILKTITLIKNENIIYFSYVIITASLITVVVLINDFPIFYTLDELFRLSIAKNILLNGLPTKMDWYLLNSDRISNVYNFTEWTMATLCNSLFNTISLLDVRNHIMPTIIKFITVILCLDLYIEIKKLLNLTIYNIKQEIFILLTIAISSVWGTSYYGSAVYHSHERSHSIVWLILLLISINLLVIVNNSNSQKTNNIIYLLINYILVISILNIKILCFVPVYIGLFIFTCVLILNNRKYNDDINIIIQIFTSKYNRILIIIILISSVISLYNIAYFIYNPDSPVMKGSWKLWHDPDYLSFQFYFPKDWSTYLNNNIPYYYILSTIYPISAFFNLGGIYIIATIFDYNKHDLYNKKILHIYSFIFPTIIISYFLYFCFKYINEENNLAFMGGPEVSFTFVGWYYIFVLTIIVLLNSIYKNNKRKTIIIILFVYLNIFISYFAIIKFSKPDNNEYLINSKLYNDSVYIFCNNIDDYIINDKSMNNNNTIIVQYSDNEYRISSYCNVPSIWTSMAKFYNQYPKLTEINLNITKIISKIHALHDISNIKNPPSAIRDQVSIRLNDIILSKIEKNIIYNIHKKGIKYYFIITTADLRSQVLGVPSHLFKDRHKLSAFRVHYLDDIGAGQTFEYVNKSRRVINTINNNILFGPYEFINIINSDIFKR